MYVDVGKHTLTFHSLALAVGRDSSWDVVRGGMVGCGIPSPTLYQCHNTGACPVKHCVHWNMTIKYDGTAQQLNVALAGIELCVCTKSAELAPLIRNSYTAAIPYV